MNAQQLLQEISDYCRRTGLAESTFGRRAVNDGKLANRLRNGGRITTDTLDRIRAFMGTHPTSAIGARPSIITRISPPRPIPLWSTPAAVAPPRAVQTGAVPSAESNPQRN